MKICESQKQLTRLGCTLLLSVLLTLALLHPKGTLLNELGKNFDLTKKEYDLLMYFISNKSRVLTKESIAEHLWGDNIDDVDSFDFIYTHIKNVRKKIVDQGGVDYIKTVYGMGYKLG